MIATVNCLIIGAGPAGYTAAIYAARANLKPVLYTGLQPGGQLMTTTDVENYPGYPDAVTGPAMMDDFQKQAERVGADIRFGLATKVDFSGPIFRGKEVAIVGAGDTACEEALYLSNLCPHVHMIVRREQMRASKIMQDRVIAKENITIYWNSETDEILGEHKVEGVRLKNNKTNELTEIKVEGFFVAIGHKPNSDIFKDYLEMDETGYLITVPGSTRTKVAGVFAAGDVQDKIYRQAVTSAGSGCMAALDAERYLAEFFH